MATDDGPGDVLSATERRLVELVAILATDAVTARPDFMHRVVRRARRQQDTRAALLVGSGVLAATAAGLLGLFRGRPRSPRKSDDLAVSILERAGEQLGDNLPRIGALAILIIGLSS